MKPTKVDTRVSSKLATNNALVPAGTTSTAVVAGEKKPDVFDRVQPPGTGSAADVPALLQKLGLEQVTGSKPKVQRRFADNVRRLVGGLVERETKLVKHVFSALKSFGLAALACTTKADIVQLKDFAHLAIENGRPLEVFNILADVAEFIWKYPEEAREIIGFMEKAEQDTWKQKSAWMPAATGAAALAGVKKAPRTEADVVVIGGGLSAGYIMRNFANAIGSERKVLVLEKDSAAAREHAASLRNAGIVSTALDYIFDLDEAFGEKPIERIATALQISHDEAVVAYKSIHKVMAEAVVVIREFLKEKGVADDAIELRPAGGLDIVHSGEELEVLRGYVKQANALGLDWAAIDDKVLEAKYHVRSDEIAGALEMKDSAILHPGKLVKALFDYATAKNKDITVRYDTEVLHAKHDEKGDGWILVTKQGEIHAKDVIDAREAYAPYRFREARFSQIHILDVGNEGKPMGLGETNVCHSLSYMRKIGAGKFLVGSGDFPLHDPHETPKPMASVALYAAAHFKKLYADTPYNIKQVWGGVFGLSTDGLPVAGSLLKGWHVVGGAGGSGMNITPATGKQVVDVLLGDIKKAPLQPAADFSPRRFFLVELREELTRALRQFGVFHDLHVDQVHVVEGTANHAAAVHKGPLGQSLLFVVDEKTLDAMNTDAAVLFGPAGPEETEAREHAKAVWVRTQLVDVARRLLKSPAGLPLAPTAVTATAAAP